MLVFIHVYKTIWSIRLDKLRYDIRKQISILIDISNNIITSVSIQTLNVLRQLKVWILLRIKRVFWGMFANIIKERRKASITDQKIMSDSKSSQMALNSSISVDSSHQRLLRGPVLNRCRSDIQPTSSQWVSD